MAKHTPAIVVAAYNRPNSTRRLLRSITQANYPSGLEVPIVISIDGGGEHNGALQKMAQNFEWKHGAKKIVVHQDNLGLIDHIFACGDLAQTYDSIILLEDDLYVGQSFYDYAQQALDFFEHEPHVSGISLSALWFHGFTQLPFTPFLDDGDNFYMQIAWYQGQAYTAAQWQHFRGWLAQDKGGLLPKGVMHPMFGRFPKTDWFPLKTRYLVETGRFYAFPRESLTVNFGEMGTHFSEPTSFFQVPLQERKSTWYFQPFDDCTAVYDSWQELLPGRAKRLVPELGQFDFVTDFYGQRDKTAVPAEYVLTTQPSARPHKSWGLVMRPPVANLIHHIKGNGIHLTKPEHVDPRWQTRLAADWKRHAYFSKYRSQSRRQTLKYWLAKRMR